MCSKDFIISCQFLKLFLKFWLSNIFKMDEVDIDSLSKSVEKIKSGFSNPELEEGLHSQLLQINR